MGQNNNIDPMDNMAEQQIGTAANAAASSAANATNVNDGQV